jgi:hypothetical protein
VGGIGFDFGPQAADVDIDQPAVAEVVVPPHLLQELLPGEDSARAAGQLAQEPELGLGERDPLPAPQHLPGVGFDLQVPEGHGGRGVLGAAGPPEEGADARRQLLGHERLGDVVVGARLQPGHHVVGVRPGRDHHDGDIALAPEGPAHLESVDARQHEVDEHDVGGPAGEGLQSLLATGRFDDRVALVLQGHPHGGLDPLVVLDSQNACAHAQDDASPDPVGGRISAGLGNLAGFPPRMAPDQGKSWLDHASRGKKAADCPDSGFAATGDKPLRPRAGQRSARTAKLEP